MNCIIVEVQIKHLDSLIECLSFKSNINSNIVWFRCGLSVKSLSVRRKPFFLCFFYLSDFSVLFYWELFNCLVLLYDCAIKDKIHVKCSQIDERCDRKVWSVTFFTSFNNKGHFQYVPESLKSLKGPKFHACALCLVLYVFHFKPQLCANANVPLVWFSK